MSEAIRPLADDLIFQQNSPPSGGMLVLK